MFWFAWLIAWWCFCEGCNVTGSLTAFLMARKSSTAESSLLSSSPLKARAIKPDGSRSCDLSGDPTGAPWDKSATTWPRFALPNSRTAASCTETHHCEDIESSLGMEWHGQLNLWTESSYTCSLETTSSSETCVVQENVTCDTLRYDTFDPF